MILPSTQRVDVAKDNFKKIWIYGAPFSGKTTLADQAPTPLNLNTDGNVKYVTMARLPIKDEVTTTGRITKRKFAWEIFEETIEELEKGSEFKTIVVDLLEDAYEYCRLFMYNMLNITHESDQMSSWDKVRSRFLTTLKRLLNLPYNIILISHEDTSRDIMKKSNDKITAIKPNLTDKVANKIAGMVDIVARVVVDANNDTRKLSFKNDEVVFGGGRLKGITTNEVDLSWNAIELVYGEAIKNIKPLRTEPTEHEKKVAEFKEEAKCNVSASEVQSVEAQSVEETPVKRTRKSRTAEVVTEEPTQTAELEIVEESKPARRTRRVRA